MNEHRSKTASLDGSCTDRASSPSMRSPTSATSSSTPSGVGLALITGETVGRKKSQKRLKPTSSQRSRALDRSFGKAFTLSTALSISSTRPPKAMLEKALTRFSSWLSLLRSRTSTNLCAWRSEPVTIPVTRLTRPTRRSLQKKRSSSSPATRSRSPSPRKVGQ